MAVYSGYDVVIVGSGYAGAILAYNLGKEGKRVLIIEAGPDIEHSREDYMENFFLNTFKSPSSPYPPNDNSTFMEGVTPTNINAPRATIQDLVNAWNDSANSYLTYHPESKPFASTYERLAGGTGNHWMGTCLRMTDDDLKVRTRFGHGLDWPWTYLELEPFYQLAEKIIGVSADVAEQEKIGTEFPTGYAYPMRQIPPSVSDQVIADAVNGAPLTDEEYYAGAQTLVTATPAGRNSEPYMGRRVCHGNTNCTPICPIQAKFDPQFILSLAFDTGNVEMLAKNVAYTLTVDGNGMISGVETIVYESTAVPATSGKISENTAIATRYVLACNAIENAKLLLNAARVENKNVANSSGLVGKNLMDHPVYLAWGTTGLQGIASKQLFGYRGPISTSGIETLRTGSFRSNRAAWRIELGNAAWNWPAGDPYTSGQDFIYGTDNGGTNSPGFIYGNAQYVKTLNDLLTRQFRIGFLVEQDAQEINSVSLSSTYTDNLGIPRPEIRYHISDYTAAGFESAANATQEFMSRVQAINFTKPADPSVGTYFTHNGAGYNYSGAGHLCGTHVMGTDSSNSVVDAFQRSWDHPNLFLIGCGSMPSIGTENPSLTMTAMTFVTTAEILTDLS
ncbi:MAG: GMC family oxidoreductase [Rhizobiaceae bacterium]